MSPLLIFDLDGTLLDSEHGIVTSIQRALRDFSIHRTDQEVRSQIGFELEDMIGRLLHTSAEKQLLHSICDHFKDYYRSDVFEHTKLFPEIIETLQLLTHIKKGIVTNKRHATVRPVTDYFGISQYFDHLQGFVLGELLPKPAPDMIIHAMQSMGGVEEQTFYIGDTDKDITAGKAAHVHTIAVTYGICSRDELLLHKPDFCIDSFSELISIVEKSS
jgi:phosphoglycolate phosphatase